MQRRKVRRAFTLIELLVALTVGTIAIIAARSILGTLIDQADRVAGVTADLDRAANGERVLRELLAGSEMGSDPGTGFLGNARGASFSSWCAVPAGWEEPCRVMLRVAPADSLQRVDVLAALTSTGAAVPLLSGPAPISLLYLDDAANGGRWLTHWGTGIVPPLAIAIVIGGDTLVVRIGERG
jgi:prepilin-type N-terminal cleavage/methylation domain-containing protein